MRWLSDFLVEHGHIVVVVLTIVAVFAGIASLIVGVAAAEKRQDQLWETCIEANRERGICLCAAYRKRCPELAGSKVVE